MKYIIIAALLTLTACGPTSQQQEQANILSQLYQNCKRGDQSAC